MKRTTLAYRIGKLNISVRPHGWAVILEMGKENRHVDEVMRCL